MPSETAHTERIALPDAGLRLGSYRKAYELLMAGQLAGERKGGRWFVSLDAVERQRVALAESGVAP